MKRSEGVAILISYLESQGITTEIASALLRVMEHNKIITINTWEKE